MPTLVEHRPHPTVEQTTNEGIPDTERALLHEHGRNRALTGIELSLDHRTLGLAVGIRFQLQHLCLEQNLLE